VLACSTITVNPGFARAGEVIASLESQEADDGAALDEEAIQEEKALLDDFMAKAESPRW